MSKTIIGIDYSITSPAACAALYSDSKEFSDFQFLSISGNKKMLHIPTSNIEVHVTLPASKHSQIERFSCIAHGMIKWIVEHPNPVVWIEDYSFASTGKTFHIGENCGVLKYLLHLNNIPFNVVKPTTVKKYATGKGNADKNKMYDQFVEDLKIDLLNLLGEHRRGKKQDLPAPIPDLVDAYYICTYGREHDS